MPPPSSPQDDFLNGLRRCIQVAPPGQLQAIVKNLHVLISKTGDFSSSSPNKKAKDVITSKVKTAWFFKFVNKIVFEHICSNLYLGASIPFGNEVDGCAILSCDNSIVKVGKTLDPFFVPDYLKESLDDDIVGNRDGGLHVVLDWPRRRVHVVDPILLEVLRSCSMKEVLPTFLEPVKAYREWVRNTQGCDEEKDFAFTPFFDRLVRNYEQWNEDQHFRNLLALHDVLARSWQTNASSRFVDGATTRTGTGIVSSTLSSGHSNNNNNKNNPVEADGGFLPFAIAFTLHAERINSDAFWSARWKSRWILEKQATSSGWTLSGKVAVEYHSGEEGNVQMTATEDVSVPLSLPTSGGSSSSSGTISTHIDQWVFNTPSSMRKNAHGDEQQEYTPHNEVGATLFAPFQPPLAAHTTNKTVASLLDLARSIVRAIERGEDSVQQKVETGCGPLQSEAAVKALRRKMPLNNRLIDFSAIVQSHNSSSNKGGVVVVAPQTQMLMTENAVAAREAQFQ